MNLNASTLPSGCIQNPIVLRTGFRMVYHGHVAILTRKKNNSSSPNGAPFGYKAQAQLLNRISVSDVLCAGPEHEATATTAANPSYCTLPIFHAPQAQQQPPPTGHISLDGHSFNCQNPSRFHQAYHIVFVIDRFG
ncbi:hypothetical protein FRC10_010774 [Ceratobasidium sp. 414]|nr:hypothetical protein FRC10_010774 [Ceratobasidium sp. 414]